MGIMIITVPQLTAQYGYSTASMAMGKQQAKQKIIPLPEHIDLPEYYNYHLHNIPMPQKDESVHLDLRWDNTSEGKGMILQIGLATGFMDEYYDREEVNIGMVIDKSGSMSGQKLNKTKQAMLTFIDHLQYNDQLSIVAFDHAVELVRSPALVKDKFMARNAVSSIYTGGSTDLNAGIIAGYHQLVNSYLPGKTNRLIILTDALTNTGTIDPEAIIRNSGVYQAEYDVDFVFIGVGMNVNIDLARQLSQSKRNSFHFIHDPEDIEKVFNQEVESILSSVAKNVELTLDFGDRLSVRETFGMGIRSRGNSLQYSLNNMNKGLTQVVLTEFNEQYSRGDVSVTLSYDDVQSGKRKTIIRSVKIPARAVSDSEVRKNTTIAGMAQSLQKMAILYHKGEPHRAIVEIGNTISEVKTGAFGYDGDVQRVLRILEDYVSDVREIVYKD